MNDEVSCSQSLPGETEVVSETALPIGADDRAKSCRACVHSDSASGEVTVKVGGEWSIRNADDLRGIFAESLGRSRDLIVDIAEVLTCDTAVLQLIWSLHKTAVRHGRRVRIVGHSAAVESAVAALGLPVREFAGDFGHAVEQLDAAPGESSRGV